MAFFSRDGRRRSGGAKTRTSSTLLMLGAIAAFVLVFNMARAGWWSEPAMAQEGRGAATEPVQKTVEGVHGTADATPTADKHAEGDRDKGSGEEHGGGGGHDDPVAPILAVLFAVLLAAKVGGDLFERFNQPSVLGELVFGVALGNILFFVPWLPGHELFTIMREGTAPFQAADLVGAGMSVADAVHAKLPPSSWASVIPVFETHHGMSTIASARVVDILSRIGVIILLFMVGLETSFRDMVKVGVTSFLVAVVGVIAPFGLGYGVSSLLMPHTTVYVHLFVGATLCATSVGITARVFKDIGKLQTTEAKIILGAAVIDDVLGLIILAIVAGVISAAASGTSGGTSAILLQTALITFKAFAFLAGSLFIGIKATPYLTNMVSKMRVEGMKLIYSLLFAFLMSFLANKIGLAPIVGAFAAGLILEDVHFKNFKTAGHGGGEMSIEDLVSPIAAMVVPIFFIQMGVQVKLETFANVSILGVAAGLTAAAILGKQVCGLVIRDKKVSKISVGVGMIPRGEVGLIFAAIGKELPAIDGVKIIDDATFSAVVIMVIVTTLVTPPLLKFFMARAEKGQDAQAAA